MLRGKIQGKASESTVDILYQLGTNRDAGLLARLETNSILKIILFNNLLIIILLFIYIYYIYYILFIFVCYTCNSFVDFQDKGFDGMVR